MNSRSSLWKRKFSICVGTAESGRKSRWKGLDRRVRGKWVSRSESSDAKTSRMVDALYTLESFVPLRPTLRDPTGAHIVGCLSSGERCTDKASPDSWERVDAAARRRGRSPSSITS